MEHQFGTNWWDGKFPGQELQIAVYAYYIEIEFENGIEKKFEGDITIIK